jgi:hypothetical protein
MKKYIILGLAIITALQSGCVVGRRTVALPVPELGSLAASKGEISVTSVVDARGFQNKPSDPSTPSIDGDVTTLSADQKGMMIGRQRNGYGHAMGDIALPAGQSVTERTKLLIEDALRHRGYAVTANGSATNTASVKIDEFWAWFSPGMFTVSFEARVYCTVELKRAGESTPVVIKGYGANLGQVASDANWQLAYERAFKDFLTKFDAALDKTKF